MGNPFGRNTVVPLTNKSGGAVAAGDFVYIDTANNDSFTTGTTGAYTKGIGIAQQTIASNGVGLVLIEGYASLVNVNASVTRGNFLKSHTVVKQGTDAGTSRIAGTCGMFLTGGTTPDAIIWQPDLGAGSGLTDPMTTRGDMIYRDASNVTNRLAIPAAGQVIGRSGSDLAAVYPPGYEFDYAQVTGNTTITATTSAGATTIVTGNAVAYDGSTVVMIEFFCPEVYVQAAGSTGDYTQAVLYDGSTELGRMATVVNPAATSNQDIYVPMRAARRLTPSNASHTYSIRAFKGGAGYAVTYDAASGAINTNVPGFMRITKV